MIKIPHNDNDYEIECIKAGNRYIYKFYKNGKLYNSFNSNHSPIEYHKVDYWYKELLSILNKCDITSYATEHNETIDYGDSNNINKILELFINDIIMQLNSNIIIEDDNVISVFKDIKINYNNDTKCYEVRSKYTNNETKPQLIFDKHFHLDDECWVLIDIQNNMRKMFEDKHKREIKELKQKHQEEIKEFKIKIKNILKEL